MGLLVEETIGEGPQRGDRAMLAFGSAQNWLAIQAFTLAFGRGILPPMLLPNSVLRTASSFTK